MKAVEKRPKIGLALGGGGARGLAHIGVLKVLDREGIPIDMLSGTSMGGLIAAAYATGLTAADMEAEALRMCHWRNLLPLIDRSLPDLGLIKGTRVREYLGQLLGDKTFADLRVPLELVAVDLLTGQEIDLNDGPVIDAVRATVSLPGVLAPVRLGDHLLVDGGVLNNVPADVVRRMGADVIIAVDVSVRLDDASGFLKAENQSSAVLPIPFIIETLQRSRAIMEARILDHQLSFTRPEVLIQPAVEGDPVATADFYRAAEVIAAGEAAAEANLPLFRQAVVEKEKAS